MNSTLQASTQKLRKARVFPRVTQPGSIGAGPWTRSSEFDSIAQLDCDLKILQGQLVRLPASPHQLLKVSLLPHLGRTHVECGDRNQPACFWVRSCRGPSHRDEGRSRTEHQVREEGFRLWPHSASV